LFYNMEREMSTLTDLLAALRSQRLLPVLRAADGTTAAGRAAQLLAAGCRVIELTTTTPDWALALAKVRANVPADSRCLIGMGTVSTAVQARDAVNAGADFLVSPYPAPSVRAVAAAYGITFIEGGFTPGEIADAASRGPAKIFPAHVGGPAFLSSVRAVLPDSVLIPTGGIAPADANSYLAAGATAVGIGSGLPEDDTELAALFGGTR